MFFAWVTLALLSRDYADVKLPSFYTVLAPMTLAWLAIALIPEQQLKNYTGYFLLTAVVFRVIGFFTYPILEDDHFRYLWDGFLTLHYGNPYAVIPADFFADENLNIHAQYWLDGVSYPDLPTVYGPICEAFFALSFWIDPSSIWPLKLMVVVAEISVLWQIKVIAPPKGFYLYAFCPLIIHSFSVNFHSDIFAVMFLLFAFRLDLGNVKGRIPLIIVFAALAFLSKPFALIALPFLFRFKVGWWAVWLLLVLLVEIPLYLSGGTQWSSVLTMGSNWYFNAGPWLLLASVFNPKFASSFWLLTLILCFCWLFFSKHFDYNHSCYWYKRLRYRVKHGYFRGDCLFGVFLLFGAVVNPWYFIWVLIFAAIYRQYWSWAAASVLMLSYTSGINLPTSELGLYDVPTWIVIFEYGVITTALFFDGWSNYRASINNSKP